MFETHGCSLLREKQIEIFYPNNIKFSSKCKFFWIIGQTFFLQRKHFSWGANPFGSRKPFSCSAKIFHEARTLLVRADLFLAAQTFFMRCKPFWFMQTFFLQRKYFSLCSLLKVAYMETYFL
jgi:hypothetical protein